MYNSPKQKGVALKKWPLDANDVSLFKGYLKKITSEGGLYLNLKRLADSLITDQLNCVDCSVQKMKDALLILDFDERECWSRTMSSHHLLNVHRSRVELTTAVTTELTQCHSGDLHELDVL